jgi:hypothetical protein
MSRSLGPMGPEYCDRQQGRESPEFEGAQSMASLVSLFLVLVSLNVTQEAAEATRKTIRTPS